jgi:hypothetical protein
MRDAIDSAADGRRIRCIFPAARFEPAHRPCHPRRPKGGALDPEGRLLDSTRRGVPSVLHSTHEPFRSNDRTPPVDVRRLDPLRTQVDREADRSSGQCEGLCSSPSTRPCHSGIPAAFDPSPPASEPEARLQRSHLTCARAPAPNPNTTTTKEPSIRSGDTDPPRPSRQDQSAFTPFRRDGKATPATTRSHRTNQPRRSDHTNPQPVPPKRSTRRSAITAAAHPLKPRQRATSSWPRAT